MRSNLTEEGTWGAGTTGETVFPGITEDLLLLVGLGASSLFSLIPGATAAGAGEGVARCSFTPGAILGFGTGAAGVVQGAATWGITGTPTEVLQQVVCGS